MDFKDENEMQETLKDTVLKDVSGGKGDNEYGKNEYVVFYDGMERSGLIVDIEGGEYVIKSRGMYFNVKPSAIIRRL